jgi:hypothetical protein
MDNKMAADADDPGANRFYHGTRNELQAGDLIDPGRFRQVGGYESDVAYTYLTANLDEAIWEAEVAPGEGRARVYTVEPIGEIGRVANLPGSTFPGHPSMSCYSAEPLRVVGEVTDWLLYHGTRADLQVGDLIKTGYPANFGEEPRTANYVYLARTLDAAIWGAELARGEGHERIYIVQPTGAIEDDPNLTDKKYRGNPTKSFRSRDPLRITGEITDWRGHAPEVLKAMKDSVERLVHSGADIIDD